MCYHERVVGTGILNTLGDFLITSPFWGYFLLGVVFIVRGEAAVLGGTFLALRGYLTFPQLWSVGTVSVLFFDNILYFAGRLAYGTRYGKFLERKFPLLARFRVYVERHFIKTVLITKYAAGPLVTIAAGWARIPFRRFITWHTVGMVVWLILMSMVSYALLSGLDYLYATRVFRNIELGILAFIILFIFGELFVHKWLKERARAEVRHPHWDEVLKGIGNRIERFVKRREKSDV